MEWGWRRRERNRIVLRESRSVTWRVTLPSNGAHSGNHFVEHSAECKEIRARIGLSSLQLLRRHIGRRAKTRVAARRPSLWKDRPDGRELPGGRNCATPKSSSFTPDFVNMMLAGFRSRWTTAVGVSGGKCVRDVNREVHRLLQRQRPLR